MAHMLLKTVPDGSVQEIPVHGRAPNNAAGLVPLRRSCICTQGHNLLKTISNCNEACVLPHMLHEGHLDHRRAPLSRQYTSRQPGAWFLQSRKEAASRRMQEDTRNSSEASRLEKSLIEGGGNAGKLYAQAK